MPSLIGLDDLSLLPYLLDMYSNNQILPHGSYEYLQYFSDLCSTKIDDHNLFVLCKQIVEKIKATVPSQYGRYYPFYPESFKKVPDYKDRKELIDGTLISIDSLRTRVIAHNDRDALAKLEKYYKNKGNDKGIAIYYKIMLGYEGNGDLAERFYRVLAPHFDKNPEYRTVVREVLLRAAICDHNERAQELCDSLGFSLCDYRLPTPPQSPQ